MAGGDKEEERKRRSAGSSSKVAKDAQDSIAVDNKVTSFLTTRIPIVYKYIHYI